MRKIDLWLVLIGNDCLKNNLEKFGKSHNLDFKFFREPDSLFKSIQMMEAGNEIGLCNIGLIIDADFQIKNFGLPQGWLGSKGKEVYWIKDMEFTALEIYQRGILNDKGDNRLAEKYFFPVPPVLFISEKTPSKEFRDDVRELAHYYSLCNKVDLVRASESVHLVRNFCKHSEWELVIDKLKIFFKWHSGELIKEKA